MNKIWYLSPSNQAANLGVSNYGSEKEQMNLLLDEIIPHLDRAGVSFHRADADLSLESRVKESNEMGAVFHLALHSNAGGNGKARGPVAYYYSERGKVFADQMIQFLLTLGQENNRWANILQEKSFYELRKTTAPACLLEVDFHNSISGVEFMISRRSQIGEAIAKAIIVADGKEFVPVTTGEYLDEMIRLGFFQKCEDWNSPLTKEEAAICMAKLIETIRKGVIV